MTQTPLIQVPFKPDKKFPWINMLLMIVLSGTILYFGKSLFIPLSFAVLISFVLYPACAWMEKRGIHRSLSIAVSISLLIIFFLALLFLLFVQLSQFMADWPALKAKTAESLASLSIFLNENFNISVEKQDAWLNDFTNSSGRNILPLLKDILYNLSLSLVLLILIPVFSSLILYHRKLYVRVLCSFFPESKKEMVYEILHGTVHSFYSFIKGMLIVYLIVGILNSIGLAIIGVPHAVLFGFIASVLTFIPYVGIIIASLLPISISWITFNSIWYPLGVILVFSIVQYLEANIIFPLTVSKRLNVNTLATMIAIVAGGILWGAAGMILFIPFLGILKLISERTEGMETLSDLLGTSKKPEKKKKS